MLVNSSSLRLRDGAKVIRAILNIIDLRSIFFFFIFSIHDFVAPIRPLYFENDHVDAAGGNGQEHSQQLQLQVSRSCRLLFDAVCIRGECRDGASEHHDDTERHNDVQGVEYWYQVHTDERGGCKNCLSNPLDHMEDDAEKNPSVIDTRGIIVSSIGCAWNVSLVTCIDVDAVAHPE